MAAIAIQSNQELDQHGGQEYPQFRLRHGARNKVLCKAYNRKLAESIEDALDLEDESESVKALIQEVSAHLGRGPRMETNVEAFDSSLAERILQAYPRLSHGKGASFDRCGPPPRVKIRIEIPIRAMEGFGP